MNNRLIVRQQGIKDCGACALLSVIRYYDGNISFSKLLELTNTSKLGTTFLDLKNASNYLGLSAVGYKIEGELPKNIRFPFICQVIKNNYTHFIVVYNIKNKKVLVMDPDKGKILLSKEEFYNIWTSYILVFNCNKKIPYIKDNNYIKYIIIDTIKNNKRIVFNITILSFIFTLFSIINSYQLKFLLDDIFINNIDTFICYSFLTFSIIIVIRSLANFLRSQLLVYLNEKIDINLFMITIKNILYLPYNYYKNKTTGEVISKIKDISYIRNVISKVTLTVLLDLILFICCGIVLYSINITLFVISLLIVLFYIINILIFNPALRKKINIDLENNSLLNVNLIENISGYETIKGLNIENVISDKIEYLYAHSLKNIFSYNTIFNIMDFLKEFIGLIGLLLINIVGIKEITNGNMELSTLVVFNGILLYFLDPVKNLLELISEYYLASNALKRANTLYEIKPEKMEKENGIEVNGNITIENLNFSYGYKKVLKNISISIRDKEKILLLGDSGSGKSTLLKILYKYYNIKRGIVKINDYDICDFTLKDIRKNILYVSQNEMLFTDSIRNNIILNRNIREEEFLNICRLCHIDDIIKDNILGYDMLLEENGTNISGGERQRIILARSLLKKSNLVLIDEGFSQIDINLEKKILNNIFNYYNDKTFIIISHRLDNIDLYDKVIKIENGKIRIVRCNNDI